jgi:short chain dehydrogenase
MPDLQPGYNPQGCMADDGDRRRGRDRTMFEKGLLQRKRILVTGGGSGLGAAMGRRFAELGAELIICGRRLELLDRRRAPCAAISAPPSASPDATFATAVRSMP